MSVTLNEAAARDAAAKASGRGGGGGGGDGGDGVLVHRRSSDVFCSDTGRSLRICVETSFVSPVLKGDVGLGGGSGGFPGMAGSKDQAGPALVPVLIRVYVVGKMIF